MLDKSDRIWGDYYAGTSESDFAGIRRIWESLGGAVERGTELF